MSVKKKVPAVLLAVILLATQIGVALADTGTSNDVIVNQQIANGPSNEDANWPITRVETVRQKDPATGEVHVLKTIFREALPGFGSVPKDPPCPPDNGKSVTSASVNNCALYQGVVSVSSQGIAGGITLNVKHYANKFCPNSLCSPTLYQPYRLEVWWSRTSSSWTVQNAVTDWGCYACYKCDTSAFGYLWHSSSFNPAWNANNTSYTYVYTTGGGTVWPALQWFDPGVRIVGGNHGTAVMGGNQYYLATQANF
jgi:hypothetical protein